MKTIQAKPKLMVSDRAYCAIMSDCIKTLMAKGVLPHVFEVTIYVIQKYLESQIAPLNGDMFVMEFFRTFRPAMDRAIRRSAIARKAAEVRRKKKQAETRQQPESPAPQPEPTPKEQPAPPVKEERPAASVIPDPVPAASVIPNPVPAASVIPDPIPAASVIPDPVPAASVIPNPVPAASVIPDLIPAKIPSSPPSRIGSRAIRCPGIDAYQFPR